MPRRPTEQSFNHLVRAQQYRLRDRNAERLGGLEVDHELELGRLFHRKLAGLRALEDLVDEACEPEIKVRIVHRVGYQSPGLDELAGRIGGGQPAAGHRVDDRLLMHLGKTVCPDDKRVDTLSNCQFECPTQVARAAHVEKLGLETQRAGRRLCLFPFGRGSRIAHVVKQRNAREIRNQLFEELNPFRLQLGAEGRHPRNIAPGCAKLATMARGSPIVAITTGIVSVAFLAALAAGVPLVTSRSTLRRTSSEASSGNRSARPSADRYSMIRFRPST